MYFMPKIKDSLVPVSFSIATTRFSLIHVEIIGQLPMSHGCTSETVPKPDITTDTVVQALYIRWISHYYGISFHNN